MRPEMDQLVSFNSANDEFKPMLSPESHQALDLNSRAAMILAENSAHNLHGFTAQTSKAAEMHLPPGS